MSEIGDRIKQLVDRYADGNNSKFAKIVNTSETNVRNYINGIQPKYDFLKTLVEKFEISCEWLLLGSERNVLAVNESMPKYESKNDLNKIVSELKRENLRLTEALEDKKKIIRLLEGSDGKSKQTGS